MSREADIGKTTSPIVTAASRIIDAALEAGEPEPSLTSLAESVGVTPSSLKAAFVSMLKMTPKAYAAARKAERFRQALQEGAPVDAATFGAGYGSSSRVYERTGELLGMTPAAYRKGGPGETVRFAFADTSLGRVIVAHTDIGVCMIAFGDDDAKLEAQLRDRFSRARVEPAAEDHSAFVTAVVALIDHPGAGAQIPLDVRGTAFQQQVWLALTRIRAGHTVTYAELARQIGRPTAVRAVAQACGANPLAVVVPCHRVIGADGSLTGYRWGVERKRSLLERESTDT